MHCYTGITRVTVCFFVKKYSIIFIRKLKDEEIHVRSRVRAAERGEPAPRRKRRYRLLEDRIQRLRREYGAGARCVEEYWNAVAHSVHQF